MEGPRSGATPGYPTCVNPPLLTGFFVKAFTLNCHIKETILCTIDPYYGTLTKFLNKNALNLLRCCNPHYAPGGPVPGPGSGVRIRSFRKLRVPYFGVLVIRIPLFRVLYLGPLFSETSNWSCCLRRRYELQAHTVHLRVPAVFVTPAF